MNQPWSCRRSLSVALVVLLVLRDGEHLRGAGLAGDLVLGAAPGCAGRCRRVITRTMPSIDDLPVLGRGDVDGFDQVGRDLLDLARALFAKGGDQPRLIALAA